MPRGHAAKCNRAHNRAIMRGNSNVGSSRSVAHQVNGKKHNKNHHLEKTKECIKSVVYDGKPYTICYYFEGIKIYVTSVLCNIEKCSTKRTDVMANMDSNHNSDVTNGIILEKLKDLTDFALKYDKITIDSYLIMCKEEYIKGDKELCLKKMREKFN